MGQHEIKKFTIHQFKGVRGTIEIEPNGPGCIVIAGPNGAGKSSVVDGIAQLVDPAGVKGIPKPLHKGADEAFVEMTTSEARARRTYKENGPGKLDVWAVDGAKYSSGKDFMVKATGGQVFDTAQFDGISERDQRAELLRRVELPFSLDDLDAKRKGIFDTRTEVGREVTRLEGQLAGFPAPNPGLPESEVSVASLLDEYESARKHNDARRAVVVDIDSNRKRLTELDQEIAVARQRISDLEGFKKETLDHLDTLVYAEASTEFINVDVITARIDDLENVNASVREASQRNAVAESLDQAKERQAALTAELATIDKTKADGLAAAVFPVPGLSVDDTGITHEGIPFKQINAAMRIVVAFDLFTLDRPDLRLIFIKNGDLLDEVSLAGIEKIAVDRGYYVVVERSRPDGGEEFRFTVKDGALEGAA